MSGPTPLDRAIVQFEQAAIKGALEYLRQENYITFRTEKAYENFPNVGQALTKFNAVIKELAAKILEGKPEPKAMPKNDQDKALADKESNLTHSLLGVEGGDKVLAFAKKVAQEAREKRTVVTGQNSEMQAAIDTAAALLAMIGIDSEAVIDQISDDFNAKNTLTQMLRKEKQQIDELGKVETTFGLGDVAEMKKLVTADVVARAVVAENGKLNLDVTETVVNELKLSEEMTKVLHHLQNSVDAQELAESTPVPAKDTIQYEVVSALLDTSEVKKSDAVRAHVMSLLIPCDKKIGTVSNHSEICEMIRVNRADLYSKDINELIEKGAISRTIDGVNHVFKLKLEDSADLDKKVPLAKKAGGMIRSKNVSITELRALKTAFSVMGKSDEEVQTALKSIKGETTCRAIIKAVAGDDNDLKTQGERAFSLAFSNTFVNSLHSILAEMAILKPSARAKAEVLYRIRDVVQQALSSDSDVEPEVHQAVPQFVQAVLAKVHEELEFSYDAKKHSFTVDNAKDFKAYFAKKVDEATTDLNGKINEVALSFLGTKASEFGASFDFSKILTVKNQRNNPVEFVNVYKEKSAKTEPFLAPQDPLTLFEHLIALKKKYATTGRIQLHNDKKALSLSGFKTPIPDGFSAKQTAETGQAMANIKYGKLSEEQQKTFDKDGWHTLSGELKTAIDESIIRFAETAEFHNGQQVDLCLFSNPKDGYLNLGMITKDGSELSMIKAEDLGDANWTATITTV